MDKYAELTVFLAVVEQGSFSAAGRKLELSPSAVSKLIARLEARLSARLFERIAGSIRLTFEGERFRAAGEQVVQAMTAAARAAFAMGKLRDRERFIGGLLGFRLQVRNQVHASIQNRLRHSYSLAWLSWYGK